MVKLLSDEELREQINIALTEFKAKVLLSTAKDNEEAYSFGNNRLFDLINTQKKAYADMVIGEDEKHQNWCGISCDDISHITNYLRYEQRNKILKEEL